MFRIRSSDQQAFTSFYDDYAPKLWGIIVLANLPMPESEAILVNTLAKDWKQFDQRTRSEKHFFTRMIDFAHQEGLPIDHLKAILKRNQSGGT